MRHSWLRLMPLAATLAVLSPAAAQAPTQRPQPRPGFVAPRQAQPPAFTPKAVTAGQLTFTGRRFSPLALTADQLTFTGRRFAPLALTADQLTFTGRRFSPQALTADELTFTGRR